MTSRAARLAILLRRAQWELDDAAHALPEGRVSGEQCRTLADGLEELAGAIRDHAAGTPETPAHSRDGAATVADASGMK